VFYNLLGFWPNSNKLSTFGQFCNELMVQCPCNHVFGTFIYNVMVGYHNVIRPKGFPIDLRKTLVSAVPEGFILTISDKGLGPVLLPYSWYIREYKVQAVLGGHEEISISEGSLLLVLFKIIAEFRCNLTVAEHSLFLSIYNHITRICKNFAV
jgi:hypothetical protein